MLASNSDGYISFFIPLSCRAVIFQYPITHADAKLFYRYNHRNACVCSIVYVRPHSPDSDSLIDACGFWFKVYSELIDFGDFGDIKICENSFCIQKNKNTISGNIFETINIKFFKVITVSISAKLDKLVKVLFEVLIKRNCE